MAFENGDNMLLMQFYMSIFLKSSSIFARLKIGCC